MEPSEYQYLLMLQQAAYAVVSPFPYVIMNEAERTLWHLLGGSKKHKGEIGLEKTKVKKTKKKKGKKC